MGDLHPLLDGALGEHIRFAEEVAFVIHHLQGGQQEERIVCAEYGPVGAGVDDAVLGAEIVIQGIELCLLGFDHGIRVVFRLVFDQTANTVTNPDQPLDAVLGSDRSIDR